MNCKVASGIQIFVNKRVSIYCPIKLQSVILFWFWSVQHCLTLTFSKLKFTSMPDGVLWSWPVSLLLGPSDRIR